MLIYEAVRELPVDVVDVQTPMGPTTGARLSEPPVILPVLRAALGMLGPALELLPDASVLFLGLRRNDVTHQPEVYLKTSGGSLAGKPGLILDPMLATGGSLAHACQVAVDAGARSLTVVSVISAPEGIARLEASSSVDLLVTAAIDSHLDEDAFIVPGLGDAGDRQFGPQ